MNVWYWFFALSSLLLSLAVLGIVRTDRWRQKHPGIGDQRSSTGETVPRDFARDIRRAQRLEARKQRDPRVIIPLIEVYRQMAGRLRPDEYPLLYARIQASLGDAYNTLSTGDPRVNLERAIACYQQALHFYTPEEVPLEYADAQTSLVMLQHAINRGPCR
jgi:hypothetical protein